jgi:hypothetical protein
MTSSARRARGGEIMKTQNVAAQTRSLVEQGDRSPVDYEHSGCAALAIFLRYGFVSLEPIGVSKVKRCLEVV